MEGLERVTEPIVTALRRENSTEAKSPRSRARFCIDQCTAVTVSCILLLAVSIYLLTQSEQMLTHIDALLQKLLQNLTVSLPNHREDR